VFTLPNCVHPQGEKAKSDAKNYVLVDVDGAKESLPKLIDLFKKHLPDQDAVKILGKSSANGSGVEAPNDVGKCHMTLHDTVKNNTYKNDNNESLSNEVLDNLQKEMRKLGLKFQPYGLRRARVHTNSINQTKSDLHNAFAEKNCKASFEACFTDTSRLALSRSDYSDLLFSEYAKKWKKQGRTQADLSLVKNLVPTFETEMETHGELLDEHFGDVNEDEDGKHRSDLSVCEKRAMFVVHPKFAQDIQKAEEKEREKAAEHERYDKDVAAYTLEAAPLREFNKKCKQTRSKQESEGTFCSCGQGTQKEVDEGLLDWECTRRANCPHRAKFHPACQSKITPDWKNVINIERCSTCSKEPKGAGPKPKKADYHL
jgi:hypothetical protein